VEFESPHLKAGRKIKVLDNPAVEAARARHDNKHLAGERACITHVANGEISVVITRYPLKVRIPQSQFSTFFKVDSLDPFLVPMYQLPCHYNDPF